MLNVLLVEDNELFRQTLKGILTSRFPSMRIEEAGDGKEALSLTKNRPPELIFMDISLPGENGLQVTKKIRKLYPDIFIIILTSYDSLQYREAALQAGADYFISKKSSSTRDIIEFIKSLISRGVFLRSSDGGLK